MSECKHRVFFLARVLTGVCGHCGDMFAEIENRKLQAKVLGLIKERDTALAQVAVLRGALERARKGFVNLIDLNLLPSEEDEKDANEITQCCFEALLDTPTEAAERVNALVEALEAYSSEDTWGDDGEIARQALAEWRHEK